MTILSSDAPTGGVSLLRYFDLLEESMLSEAFRSRIADREHRREYPFSVQNIYQVLDVIAPMLWRGWAAVANVRALTADDPVLGTSLRCFRYLHVLLLGAQGADRHKVVRTLTPFADRAIRIESRPACFCKEPTPIFDKADEMSIDLALRLATVFRQYADVRWLGQHDQGFVGTPPIEEASGLTSYHRCFGRLPPELGHDTIAVTVTYESNPNGTPPYDIFRGEVTRPPPPELVRRATVYSPSARRPVTELEGMNLMGRVLALLRADRGAAPASVAAGNQTVATLFAAELRAAAHRAGLDPEPWQDEMLRRVAISPDIMSSRTHAYLDRVQVAVTNWRALLCDGT